MPFFCPICGKLVLEREAVVFSPSPDFSLRFCSKECRTKFVSKNQEVGVKRLNRDLIEIYNKINYAQASIFIPAKDLETVIQCLKELGQGDKVEIDPISVGRFKEAPTHVYICYLPVNWHVAFHEKWIPPLLEKLEELLIDIRLRKRKSQ
ncbi:MAG: hypothetical protein KIH10_16020 [Candidatus Freyarchaeota archaeon]|nr:hypothetical protein [Candidatus Jordarchaeia archaeon]